jgi:hypothetical protein
LGPRESARVFGVACLVTLSLVVSLLTLPPWGVKAAEWTFHCADGRAAHLQVGSTEDGVRLSIDRQIKPELWSIILQRHDRIEDRSTRVLKFEARADAPRDAVCAVRGFAPPWDNLGLHKEIRLDPEWRSFEFSFVPQKISSMVVTEWLLGSSAIPIEVRGYSLARQPAQDDGSNRPPDWGSRAGGP